MRISLPRQNCNLAETKKQTVDFQSRFLVEWHSTRGVKTNFRKLNAQMWRNHTNCWLQLSFSTHGVTAGTSQFVSRLLESLFPSLQASKLIWHFNVEASLRDGDMIDLQSLAFGAFKLCVAVFGNQINQKAFEFFFLLFCYLPTCTNNAFDVIPLSLSVLLSNCFLKHQQLPFPSIFGFNQSEHINWPVVHWRFQQSSAFNLGLHGRLGLRLVSFESTTTFETSFHPIGVKCACLPFCQMLVCPFLENVSKGLHWKWVLHHLRNLGMLFLTNFECFPKETFRYEFGNEALGAPIFASAIYLHELVWQALVSYEFIWTHRCYLHELNQCLLFVLLL